MPRMRPVLLLAVAIALLAAASAQATSGIPLAGQWVATTPAGKIVLKLQLKKKVLQGTWAQAGKTSKIVAHVTNADGAQQVTITFLPTHRSTLCGVRTGKLYCTTNTGMATFAHA